MKTKLRKLLKATIFAYIFITVYLFLFQRSHLYHPDTNLKSPSDYGIAMQEIKLKTPDGVTITSWFAKSDNLPYIVYFHGNAQNISTRKSHLTSFMNEGFGVMAISYRGYGTSEGSPSEEGLYNDARTAINYLKGLGVSEKEMILYGESLGTGIATKMATEINAKALILEAPYKSIADRAQEIYFFLPVKYIVWDNFESIEKIKNMEEPVLIIHGEKDAVMPAHHGKEIFAAANEPKKLLLFPDGGHNNSKNSKYITKIIKEFISSYQ